MAQTPRATFDADFTKFVSELTKVDAKLKDFQPSADAASARLQRMANSLTGNKLFEQAALAVTAIQKVGGVSSLSAGEVQRLGRQFEEVGSKARAVGVNLGTAFQTIQADLAAARTATKALGDTATETTSRFAGLGKAALQGAGFGAGFGAVNVVTSLASGLKDQVTDTIALGDSYARLSKGFTALQGGALAAQGTLEGLRRSTQGLVSDSDLMLRANQANVLGLQKLGVDLNEASLIASRLGAALGKDAATSIEQFQLALAKGSSERLDELGISLKLNEAYDEYAQRLKKSASDLTDFEKAQAFATIGLERGRDVLKRLGDDTLTAGQQVDRLGVAFENLKAQIGSSGGGTGAIASSIGAIADSIGSLARNIEEGKRAYADLLTLLPGSGSAGQLLGATAQGALASIGGTARVLSAAAVATRNQAQSLGLIDIPLVSASALSPTAPP